MRREASPDLVLNYNLSELAHFLGAEAREDAAWRVMTLVDEPGERSLVNMVRAGLRCDPDALLIRSSRSFTPEALEMLVLAVQTGHAIILVDAAPEAIAALSGVASQHDVACESGRDFLARLPEKQFHVVEHYLVVDQAPLPPGLEAGWERYQTYTATLPVDFPPPVQPGDTLTLRTDTAPYLESPQVALYLVLPEAVTSGQLAAGVFTPEAIAEARAHVYDVARYEDPEEAPGECWYRILVDLPAAIGAQARSTGGYPNLTSVGRTPYLVLR
ncbi:MAG TPA: hypothetical protein V6D47_20765 [Oscillatoriaceae cyanobacterium]